MQVQVDFTLFLLLNQSTAPYENISNFPGYQLNSIFTGTYQLL